MISPVWMLLGLPMPAFVIAVAGLPLMKRIAARYAIVAAPYSETLQKRRVPLLGGVAIISAILIPLALSKALPLWIGLPTLALLLVGVIDDAAAMRPLRKFVLQLIVVTVVVVAAPRLALTPWRLLNVILAGFFLLSTINAFNLIDGLDGLAGGVGIAAGLAAAGV